MKGRRMPPRKLPATTIAPAPSAKRTPGALGAYRKPDAPQGDVHTEARNSRTQEYMADARRREAELEKRGYCF